MTRLEQWIILCINSKKNIMKNNIIITGLPGSGKSTLLKKIVTDCSNKVGFVTSEILNEGKRTGFVAETCFGERSIIASIGFCNKSTENTHIFKVSKYFVSTKNLNRIIPQVSNFKKKDLLYLDEIGQMQARSSLFRELVSKYLDSENISILTLSSVYTDDFINDIKSREDTILVKINKKNRKEKEVFVKKLLEKILKAKRYASEPWRFNIECNKITMTTDHGEKHLIYSKDKWVCDCDFYAKNKICSHALAVEKRGIKGINFKIKKDKYRKSRGNTSKILDISCVCGNHVCYYQKDGPGQLKRMYLDRIFDIPDSKSHLKCEKCKKLIGTPMIYKKENRPALRAIRGTTTKKQIQ